MNKQTNYMELSPEEAAQEIFEMGAVWESDKAKQPAAAFWYHKALEIIQAQKQKAREEERERLIRECERQLEEEFFNPDTKGGIRFAMQLIAYKAIQLNATSVSHEIEGLTYDGRLLGDWKVTVESLRTPIQTRSADH